MIQFKKRVKFPKITEIELQAFENKIGKKLPYDYRQHMINFNGGKAIGENIYFDLIDDDIIFSHFHALKDPDNNLVLERYNVGFSLLDGIIISNIRGGCLAISLSNQDFGAIYAFYSDTDPFKIANSFTEFIEGLVDYGPEVD